MTGCVCEGPGYCQRHGVEKNDGWWRLCRGKPKYFAAWEAHRGPGQTQEGQVAFIRKPPGPGTLLCKMLGCGGFHHQAKLNEWGPDGCEQHLEQIVEWIHEPSKNVSISDEAARRLIGLAITKARANLER